MGGVDLNDQLRKYYEVRLKGRKYYKYLWWFIFDVAVTNAFLLSKHYTTQTVTSVKGFRTDLARALIAEFNGRKRRGRPSSQSGSSSSFCEDHFPRRAEKQRRRHFCYTSRRERHETTWYCDTCQMYLCHSGRQNDCYLLYHRQLSQAGPSSSTV